MKKKVIIIVSFVLAIVIGGIAWVVLVGNKRSPAQTATVSNAGLDIKVTYCSPYKKGRLIFGDAKDKALQPYGQYWRLGANAATEITFNKAVHFGDKNIPAGTYTMYAIPGATTWEVALNGEVQRWGYSEPDYSKDVARVTVPATTAPESESFVIDFQKDSTAVSMDFKWDKTLVRVPISAQ